MKKLKLLGVLLVSLMVFGLSVNAETTVTNIEDLKKCLETSENCVLGNNIVVENEDFTKGKIEIPAGMVLTIAGKTKVSSSATIKAIGDIRIATGGVLDATDMSFGATGLIANQPGQLIIEEDGTFIALNYWDVAYQKNGGWSPMIGAHLFKDCKTGATVLSGDKAYVLINNEWKGAIEHNGNNYAKVADALNVAGNNDTIKLLANIYTDKGINISKNITLELNGKQLTVTGKDDAIIVNNGVTVTIKGNGIVNSEQAAVFNKGGNVTIEDGTYNSSVWYTIKNLGTMTIKGGVFTQSNANKGNSSLIANGWASSVDKGVKAPEKTETTAKAIMTITGGRFIHHTTTSTIKSDDWSKTTINGGNFESKNGTLVQATGEVLINAGTFLGYNNLALFNGTGDAGYEPAKLNITGGEFTSKYIIWTFTGGNLNISGGIFKEFESIRNPRELENEIIASFKGGTYNFNPKDFVEEGYVAILKDDKYDILEEFDVKNHPKENGKITFDKEFAIAGETVTMTITPNEGYEIESIKVTDMNNKIIEVKDNKFIMPESDVDVIVKFKEIVKEEVKEENKEEVKEETKEEIKEEKVEVTVPDKESSVLVDNEEKTENILLETLAKNDKYKDLDVKVLVVTEEVKATEEITKEFKESLAKEKIENAKIVNFFDISIQVKNKVSEKVEGYLTELTEKITFTVELPKLEEVKEGYTRKYYVIKKHNDKVEILDTKVSEDGKSITFETDEFSTYALAYEDELNSASAETLPSIPQTSDGIIFTLFVCIMSLIGFVSINKYFKKQLNK